MSRADVEIDVVALSGEIDAASSLLRHGFATLTDYRFASRDAEPLFACLGGGTEKLLKLTFGLMRVEAGSGWPSKAEMRGAGHRVVDLDATVRGLIAERQASSTAPGLIAELLRVTHEEPVIAQVLATLERYAVTGRFYNLDLLGGDAQSGASPQELWRGLEAGLLAADSSALQHYANARWDEGRRDLNSTIARGLWVWCELLLRSWVTGVCGAAAKRWSAQLDFG